MASIIIKNKLTHRVAIVKMDDGGVYKKKYPSSLPDYSDNDATAMLEAIKTNTNCLMRLNGLEDFIVREKAKYYYSSSGHRLQIDGLLFEDKIFEILSRVPRFVMRNDVIRFRIDH
jgi:hypothetical protein